MAEPIFHYDEASDTLYISFAPGEAATGIALNDQILLRINKPERRAIGLTVFDYSVVAQATDVGPRSFPLTGLTQLSEDLRALVLDILHRPPLCQLLSLSVYTPSLLEAVPLATLHPVPVGASDM